MGWLFKSSLGPHDTPKAHLDALYTWSNDEIEYRVLRSAVRGRVYYAAVERVSWSDGCRSVTAAVCLFHYTPRARDGHVFGYKDMEESMGPHYWDCPAAILDLLTETEAPYAIKWRADCRARLSIQTEARKTPRPKAGDILVLAQPVKFADGARLSRFSAARLPPRRNLVYQSLDNYRFYRLPKLATLEYVLNPSKEEGRDGEGGLQPKEIAMSESDIANTRAATVVPEERRLEFLPRLFSERWLLRAENAVYDFMTQLSADYGGGLWAFFERDGQPLYMAPDTDRRFRISWWGNGYEGEVSADAAGIIACLFTFSHLSMRFGSEHLAEAFERLHDYACEHGEASEILRAID